MSVWTSALTLGESTGGHGEMLKKLDPGKAWWPEAVTVYVTVDSSR